MKIKQNISWMHQKVIPKSANQKSSGQVIEKKHKELKILSGISYEDFHGENIKKMLMLFKTYTRGANRLKKELAERKLLIDLKAK